MILHLINSDYTVDKITNQKIEENIYCEQFIEISQINIYSSGKDGEWIKFVKATDKSYSETKYKNVNYSRYEILY